MDAFTDPAVSEIIIMSSAQVGKSECLNNILGYTICVDPAPVLLIQPNMDLAKAWVKDRFLPLVRDSPSIASRMRFTVERGGKMRDRKSSSFHYVFAGGQLALGWSNSPSSLASRSAKVLLLDEVDRYPQSAKVEGDPVGLARKRVTAFGWNSKIVAVSTPTVRGISRIESLYFTSDQRKFEVPCLACSNYQELVWEGVKFDDFSPATARYQCQHCGDMWDDARRWSSVRVGRWAATQPFTGIAGFHVSELYSSFVRLHQVVANFLAVHQHPDQLRVFVNTSMGRTWVDKGDCPDWRRLYDRREDYPLGKVPYSAFVLTAGADVQKDRIEISIYGWGRNRESWLVDHIVLAGDTDRDEIWSNLTGVLNMTWAHEAGVQLSLARMAIDSGYATNQVYLWARRQGMGRVFVTKGANTGLNAPIVGSPGSVDFRINGQRIRATGLKVWPVGTHVLKMELYGQLNLEGPTEEQLDDGVPYPKGYCHFPKMQEEFFRQLTAEQLVVSVFRGKRKMEWQKLRDRNEVLDTRVLARVAAFLMSMDRWNDRKWDQLEGQITDAVGRKEAEEARMSRDAKISAELAAQVVKETPFADFDGEQSVDPPLDGLPDVKIVDSEGAKPPETGDQSVDTQVAAPIIRYGQVYQRRTVQSSFMRR